jgi:flavin-binding protein dodecin
MSAHVYKSLELTGSSPVGIEDAVSKAIAKGHVVDGKVAHWQVTLKVGFTLE